MLLVIYCKRPILAIEGRMNLQHSKINFKLSLFTQHYAITASLKANSTKTNGNITLRMFDGISFYRAGATRWPKSSAGTSVWVLLPVWL